MIKILIDEDIKSIKSSSFDIKKAVNKGNILWEEEKIDTWVGVSVDGKIPPGLNITLMNIVSIRNGKQEHYSLLSSSNVSVRTTEMNGFHFYFRGYANVYKEAYIKFIFKDKYGERVFEFSNYLEPDSNKEIVISQSKPYKHQLDYTYLTLSIELSYF